MSKRDVVVLGAARSPIGTFGGSLAEIEPAELAGTVMKEAIKRSGVDPKLINYVTVGNTIPADSRFPYGRGLRRAVEVSGDDVDMLP
jgi:acetyl-CoA C-acetyltransferase